MINNIFEYLKENKESKPIAIFMAGGAGSGKSTVVKSIKDLIPNVDVINADKFVEDKDSPMYNSVLKASNHIRKNVLPKSIEDKKNLIYDTTAANPKTLIPFTEQAIKNGYKIAMIMVYVHPIVSFMRNFKRERKVPTIGVLKSWLGVYTSMETYKEKFGDNFMLVSSPPSNKDEHDMVLSFNKAIDSNNLDDFFNDLLEDGNYKSTFRKDDNEEMSPEDLEKLNKSRERTQQMTKDTISDVSKVFKDIDDKVEPLEIGELPYKIDKLI